MTNTLFALPPLETADLPMSATNQPARLTKRLFSWARRPRRPAPRRTLLELEALEARALPSVVTIGASKDNTLFSESDSLSDGVGQNFFVGETGSGGIRRGLIAFDIAGNVPAGATINSVSLRLFMDKTGTGAETVQLQRL